MIEAIAAVGLLLIALVGTTLWGASRSTALLFLGVAMLLPRNLVVWELADDLGYNVEIAAGAGPTIMTHGAVAIGGAIIAVFSRGRRAFDPIAVSALAVVVVSATLLWPPNLRVAGGVVYLLTAVCAWVFGRFMGSEVHEDVRSTRLMALAVSGLLVLEAALCAAQIVLGITDINGRPAGSFDHSGALGKNAITLLLLVLPFTRSSDSLVRWSSWAGVAAAVGGTFLTGSRANLAGVGIAVLLWILLMPRAQVALRYKVLLPIGLAIAALPFLPTILRRFAEDPDGGDRPELFEAGLRMIGEHFWTGTGPNNFVATAALTEPIVQRTGYPMHNTYLLPVAELGIFGAVAFALFWLVPLVAAVRILLKRTADTRADFARAFVVVSVALAPVAWTGWGLLGWNSLFLLMFCGAFAAQRILRPAAAPSSLPSSREQAERAAVAA